MKRTLIAALLLAATASTASAATLSFGPVSRNGSGPNIAFNNLVTPSVVNGDAIFTFSVRADLNWFTEYVTVFLDGVSLGRVFDNNTSNDAFDFDQDRGTQHTRLHTGSATIAQSVFAGLVADGELDILFDFSREVNFQRSVRHLSGSITYDSTVDSSPLPAAVPLPAPFALLGAGLVGLGALRRRKRAQ